jgi:acyl carrier protein
MTSSTPITSEVEELREKIREIVVEILEVEPDEVTLTSRFLEDHEADSLRTIEILAALERRLSVEIDQTELTRMINLESVYAVVEEASGGQQ